jgi:hypothetical protein
MMPIRTPFFPGLPQETSYAKIIVLEVRRDGSFLGKALYEGSLYGECTTKGACCILRRSPRGVEKSGWEKVKGGDEPMADLVWQEAGVLLASGAIGSLLVYGYQNWLKR